MFEDFEPFIDAGTAGAFDGGAVGFVKAGFEYVDEAESVADGFEFFGDKEALVL